MHGHSIERKMRNQPNLLHVDLSVLEKHLMPCLGVRDLFCLAVTCKTLRERVLMLPKMPHEVRWLLSLHTPLRHMSRTMLDRAPFCQHPPLLTVTQ